MSALSIVQPWRHCVATQLLPTLHQHQSYALADLSFALAAAGHCHAAKLALSVPTTAKAISSTRRVERFLANPRLPPRRVQQQLAQALMAPWAGQTLILILDETPKANDLRAMTLRLAYRHRALPLASVEYVPHRLPRPLPHLVRSLLRQVQRCLPPHANVVLLADRGLAWPLLVDWCTAHQWHYVLRLQGQTKVRDLDGVERSARDLAPRRGCRWLGPAEVFKKAGWRGAHVVATWEREMKEPWLLVTDERASLRHCRRYGKRMWGEESFRDDKSSGFHWEESHVNHPTHAGRLLLLVALAMLLAASLGTVLVKRGQRRDFDPHQRRRLSIVQLGLRWLRYALQHAQFYKLPLDRLYLYPS